MLIPYRYWNRTRNSGDAIMAYVLQNVIGATPFQVTSEVTHLLGIGSIFFLANRNSYIWGSGLLRPGELRDVDPSRIRAVRGKKTLDFLKSHFPSFADVPLGDPGILMEYLRGDQGFARRPIKYKAAIIPHYKSLQEPIFRDLVKNKDVCIVDMHDDTLRPLELIWQSEVVVSQSLHGLIYASALNKPHSWISRTEDDGWLFKFHDWFSTTDNPQRRPLSLDAPLTDWVSSSDFRPCNIDRNELLNAFPDEVRQPFNRPIIDFQTIRSSSPLIIRTEALDTLKRSVLIADLDRGRLNLFNRVVRKSLEDACVGRSEASYVVLAAPGFLLNRGVAEQLTRFLDRHVGIEGMSIFRKDDVSIFSRAGIIKKLSERSFSISKAEMEVAACYIIRPGAKFDVSKIEYSAFV